LSTPSTPVRQLLRLISPWRPGPLGHFLSGGSWPGVDAVERERQVALSWIGEGYNHDGAMADRLRPLLDPNPGRMGRRTGKGP
jgi:hypothetical protein